MQKYLFLTWNIFKILWSFKKDTFCFCTNVGQFVISIFRIRIRIRTVFNRFFKKSGSRFFKKTVKMLNCLQLLSKKNYKKHFVKKKNWILRQINSWRRQARNFLGEERKGSRLTFWKFFREEKFPFLSAKHKTLNVTKN